MLPLLPNRRLYLIPVVQVNDFFQLKGSFNSINMSYHIVGWMLVAAIQQAIASDSPCLNETTCSFDGKPKTSVHFAFSKNKYLKCQKTNWPVVKPLDKLGTK